jgi:hypothetical protein
MSRRRHSVNPIIGKRHLAYVISEFMTFYNTRREHMKRDHLPPFRDVPDEVKTLTMDQNTVKSYVGGWVGDIVREKSSVARRRQHLWLSLHDSGCTVHVSLDPILKLSRPNLHFASASAIHCVMAESRTLVVFAYRHACHGPRSPGVRQPTTIRLQSS